MNRKFFVQLVFWGMLMHSFIICANTPITLIDAEELALTQAPELKEIYAYQLSHEQKAIAVGQLQDPKLKLGAMNVPVDTFDITQENMTQLQVGLSQAFPRGRSLKYRSLETKYTAKAFAEKNIVMQLSILRSVRMSWLELYHQLQAKVIIEQQKQVFENLLTITESLLANNKAQQKDVIRAQLELSELDNRLIVIDKKIDTARAQLARWIGLAQAKNSNPSRLPSWKLPPNLTDLQKLINQHPELVVDNDMILAKEANVKYAKQQYFPGFNLGVVYGFRQGDNMDGSRRSDFLSAQADIDLPIFTKNRQAREVQASLENKNASLEQKQVDHRRLTEEVEIQYSIWHQSMKSLQLYQTRLLKEAKQYAEATLIAYQNNQTDFPTLARSYIMDLTTQLAALDTEVSQYQAHAHLRYLQGE